mgnify:CR=1 FL=1
MTDVSLRMGDSPTSHYVTVGDLTLLFSYETVVAFKRVHGPWVVSENVWSNTTGKHLNETGVPVRSRVRYDDFRKRLAGVLSGVEL